ncbi:MAG: endonuclease/exonuclease/phosphatase family protein [Pseudomonadota bacterium]
MMRSRFALLSILVSLTVVAMPSSAQPAPTTLRIATFNVSMEGGNYVGRGERPSGMELPDALAADGHAQISNIAEIIQHIRPDILLLNEFDFHEDQSLTVQPFLERYLGVDHGDAKAIDYPYHFYAPVNTGVDSGVDLDGDGIASGSGNDAFGYGLYPGQFGMLLLSRYPIHRDAVRTFQNFLWKDMPENLMASMEREDGEPWYNRDTQDVLRLSSKSHWDVPVQVGDATIHVLASHPTPPVFDGPEDRNGRRNHDEIRFWADYITSDDAGDYIYDDNGHKGTLEGARFVVLGDLNASVEEGDARREGIKRLLGHEKVRRGRLPTSDGGRANRADSPFGRAHTASWGMRADYVVPSKAGWRLKDAGVFWPTSTDALYRLVKNRQASSDHRLVWIDLELDP